MFPRGGRKQALLLPLNRQLPYPYLPAVEHMHYRYHVPAVCLARY